MIGFMTGPLSLALMLLAQTPQDAQKEQKLAELLSANRYEIKLDDGRLEGPGLDFLTRAASNAQFVALAEQHFTSDIPKISSALFDHLQAKHGFQYACVEFGPVAIRSMMEPPFRGDSEKSFEYANRYPYALAFNSDQEVEFLAHVGKQSRGKGRPVWGVDQEFGATHVLDEVASSLNRVEAKKAIEDMRLGASAHEKARGATGSEHFMSGSSPTDFETLIKAVGPNPGSKEMFGLEQLRHSSEVYSYYHRANNGEPVGRLNNYVREEMMKTLFMEEYRLAQSKGDALPKVMLKFGHWHIYRGLSPGSIFPLGNFVSEFAKSNDMESLHIAFMAATEEQLKENSEYLRPFVKARGDSEWVLLDLRPLRNYWHAGLIPSGNNSFRRTLFGFDVLFMMKSVSKGTTTRTVKPE